MDCCIDLIFLWSVIVVVVCVAIDSSTMRWSKQREVAIAQQLKALYAAKLAEKNKSG
jgi:hypothetical protein